MIEVNGLVKRFDGFAALDGAALSVPAGSVYGLVGPNGAGKSTLIRHLTGIFRQDAGTVRIGGEDVWENAARRRGSPPSLTTGTTSFSPPFGI